MTCEELINMIEHGCIYRDECSETLKTDIISLKKQMPETPILDIIYPSGIKSYNCPVCGKGCLVRTDSYCPKYCSNCGQALDWSDTE